MTRVLLGLLALIIVTALLFVASIIDLEVRTARVTSHDSGVRPWDQDVEQARSSKQTELASLLEQIESHLGAVNLATSYSDRCGTGQNNYKVWEGFLKQCKIMSNRFFGLSGNIQEHLLAFEAYIYENGWSFHSESIDMPISRDITAFRNMVQGTDTLPAANPGYPYQSGYFVYNSGQARLEIACADKTVNLHTFVSGQRTSSGIGMNESFRHQDDQILEHEQIVKLLTDSHDPYACLISVEDTYYVEPLEKPSVRGALRLFN